MDPNQAAQTTLPVVPPIPGSPNLSDELKHVNQEMYKKNLELLERNKTLSLLRKIDEIILSKVTDIAQIAQQVANVVAEEAEFKSVSVLLADRGHDELVRVAISQTESVIRAEIAINKSLTGTRIPLNDFSNIIVKAVNQHQKQVTTNYYDTLRPSFTLEEAKQIQETIGIKTSIVYPLIVRGELIGALTIGTDEDEAALSDFKRDLIARLAGVIGIAIDNALLYQKIQEANERLKQLDKLKDEFVSLASHELRTPMTAVKSYLWMILEDKQTQLPDKQKGYLQRALESTDRLIKLVNDMLNISRIESGRMTLTMQNVDMVKLAKDSVSEILPAAQKQGINLSVKEPTVQIPMVSADINKIKEVLINLVGNSIKFTPPQGYISVFFSLVNGMVVVTITDTGAGIKKDDLQKLFQKFSIVGSDNSKKLNVQGTGLGLYLSKSIVEMHGGKIWVSSEGEGKGTTFSFSLRPAVQTTPQPLPIVTQQAGV